MTTEMSLDEFRATGRDCDDLGAELNDEVLEGALGRLYLDELYVERRPENGWINDADGEWHLLIGNCEWMSDDLASLEERLYRFAVDEGYFA